MVELTQGDIIRADAEALVNSVNCVGVMGRGIALQFRKAFPENFKVYKAACDRKELRPGMMMVHDLGRLTNPRFISCSLDIRRRHTALMRTTSATC